MGSAYTPGLTVSSDVVLRRVRRLPIKGEVLVRVGQKVRHDEVIARAMLPGLLQTIKLAEKLNLEPKDALSLLQVKVGDPIEKGQLIAETKGLFGRFFRTRIHSDYTGTLESITESTGILFIREPSIPVEMTAYITGEIVEVMEGDGAVIQTRGAMVQGIFGVGPENNGEIRVAVPGPDRELRVEDIRESDRGKILIGGLGARADAIRRAQEVGAVGLVIGSTRDSDLVEVLGYDIGVAITGQEAIGITIVVTEGFGELRMAERTFELLTSVEGKNASINGATQIRAGVIRPEIIVPLDKTTGADGSTASTPELTIGSPIRIIREPYFGRLGTVTELPPQLQVVDSGAEVRVLKAKLESGEIVCVPRANVEIIAV